MKFGDRLITSIGLAGISALSFGLALKGVYEVPSAEAVPLFSAAALFFGLASLIVAITRDDYPVEPDLDEKI